MADDQVQTQQGQDGQQTQGQTQTQGETPGADEQPFEAWLGAQDEATRQRIDGHTGGLRTALQTEREQRRAFERQVKELSGKLEQGSDARAQLEQMSSQLAEQQRRADFYEEAVPARIRNPKLAYIAAKDAGLIDGRSGKVNMDGLKQQFPELFEQKAPPPQGNAGAGTGGQQLELTGNEAMNAGIRRAAGRT